ncbi:MAG: hypothetical protein RBT49_08530 [Bacteroidales bacterium]|jgi:hypothetical protein|nr:hypothetical protein [Bacteroidales bacterium]
MKDFLDGDIIDKIAKEAKLCELIDLMTNKYCPINKGNCLATCVHFDCGKVFGDGEEYRIKKPSCKLWK